MTDLRDVLSAVIMAVSILILSVLGIVFWAFATQSDFEALCRSDLSTLNISLLINWMEPLFDYFVQAIQKVEIVFVEVLDLATTFQIVPHVTDRDFDWFVYWFSLRLTVACMSAILIAFLSAVWFFFLVFTKPKAISESNSWIEGIPMCLFEGFWLVAPTLPFWPICSALVITMFAWILGVALTIARFVYWRL